MIQLSEKQTAKIFKMEELAKALKMLKAAASSRRYQAMLLRPKESTNWTVAPSGLKSSRFKHFRSVRGWANRWTHKRAMLASYPYPNAQSLTPMAEANYGCKRTISLLVAVNSSFNSCSHLFCSLNFLSRFIRVWFCLSWIASRVSRFFL